MPDDSPPHPAISDYAIIGDCRSAALVSRDGSLDWLCWPRFDSPSLFGALLDQAKGGRFAVRPVQPFSAERRYVPDTNILETTFRTSSGTLRLTDLMPVCSEADKRRELWPQHQILRAVECPAGEVEVELVCDPRPDYARTTPRLRDRGALGIHYEHRDTVLVLRSDLPLALSADGGGVRGRAVLRAGERRHVSLVFSQGEPAVIPPLGAPAERKIRMSAEWWQQWARRCTYAGPHRAAVVRSALTLKLMAYAPSGAVVAAPTTSLPEQPGGSRNWDYRYCWLRDASLTLQALFDLGYPAEAESFLGWLIHTTRISWPELKILYDVYGRTDLKERQLDRLAGFGGARPVRVGNAAEGQLQLDVYGEVLDAVYQFVQRGGGLDRATARMLIGFGDTVCRRWREPDDGIWEVRAARRQHTYSKAMCWVALDRLLRLHAAGLLRAPAARLARERDAIGEEIERHGFDPALQSYVSVLGGDTLDAALLQLGRYGYVDPASPRMRGTLTAVHARLGRNGLLYRYLEDDGLAPGEGAFGICSFWAVTAQALGGDRRGAAAAFERLLGYANDVGLFAEEIDPATGAALGNFPQAFTHVGLIDAALTLAPGAARGGRV
ncbi:MAG TPA: glycoside hydrolase family 15 protein [Gemmatimonadales bacterium]|jgi:GH15 family glucan-1,4-alpha-glucosidase|nr:glycoside hydrolase family 15 protein [Gemmatimonadales bacterium]